MFFERKEEAGSLKNAQGQTAGNSEGIQSPFLPGQGLVHSLTDCFPFGVIFWRRKALLGKGKSDPDQNPRASGSALQAGKSAPPASQRWATLGLAWGRGPPRSGAARSPRPFPPPCGSLDSNGAACPGRGHARLAARAGGAGSRRAGREGADNGPP